MHTPRFVHAFSTAIGARQSCSLEIGSSVSWTVSTSPPKWNYRRSNIGNRESSIVDYFWNVFVLER